MFCSKCGTKLEENALFCPACGTRVQQDANQFNQDSTSSTFEMSRVNQTIHNFQDTNDMTHEFDPADIAQNKVLALFSYLGIFIVIPWLAAPNSPYAKFHVKQGVTLLVVDFAYGILSFLIGLIKVTKYESILGYQVGIAKVTPWFLTLPLRLVGLLLFVIMVIGIVNAVSGKAKELPIIGKIHILK